jgi:hypothetical protein
MLAVVMVKAAHAQSSTVPEKVSCSSAPWYTHGYEDDNFRSDCKNCRNFGVTGIASFYKIRSSNALTVAYEYAQISYLPRYVVTGFMGCLRGFAIRRSQGG